MGKVNTIRETQRFNTRFVLNLYLDPKIKCVCPKIRFSLICRFYCFSSKLRCFKFKYSVQQENSFGVKKFRFGAKFWWKIKQIVNQWLRKFTTTAFNLDQIICTICKWMCHFSKIMRFLFDLNSVFVQMKLKSILDRLSIELNIKIIVFFWIRFDLRELL